MVSPERNTITLAALLTGVARVEGHQWNQLNWLLRWLLMVRAVVLVLTVNSVLIGVVLALESTAPPWDRVLALSVGLVLAHATNNLINDWVDHRTGVDKDNYFRRQYGAHVLEDGLVSPFQFACVTATTGGFALVCATYLLEDLQFDGVVVALTIVGAFFVLFYTWPLKHFALGELAVFLVWGPLMTAGSYYVLTAQLSVEVLLVSVAAGIGPALVILGKHMDKYGHDVAAGIHTLPVVLGLPKSRWVSRALIVLQWLTLAGLLVFYQMFFVVVCLLTLGSLVSLWARLGQEPPTEPPEDYPVGVWPLWHTAAAFTYSRNVGVTLLVCLVLEVLLFH